MNEEQAKQEAIIQMSMAKQAAMVAQNFVVRSREEYVSAGETLKTIKARWKQVEEKRTSLVKPLNDVVRNINNMFMPVLKEWDDIMNRVKAAMQAFEKYEAEQQRLALEAAAQLAQQGQTGQEFVALMRHGSQVPQQVKGISKRAVTRWRVVDAALIPRDYLCPDSTKIETAVKAGVTVPGVEVYTEEIMAVRPG